MALLYEEHILAHKSIYISEAKERTLRLQYSIPEEGTTTETGILFLIPAYGGNLDSKVYKKMRMQFPDKYNLIVIQCDYFGIEHMQGMLNEVWRFVEIASRTDNPNCLDISLNENLDSCNDMGLMQAVDILQAGLYVIHKLSSLGVKMNFGKIIVYGSSHGSYLGYVMNRLCPNFFSLLIDNSSYCIPNYLYKKRPLNYGVETEEWIQELGFSNFRVNVDYIISRQREKFLPDEFYDLYSLYRDFKNQCMILSFHGTDDAMVSIFEKKRLIENIERASLIEISRNAVDGAYFKSSVHGLDVDLLNLYEAVENLTKNIFTYKDNLEISTDVVIERNEHKIIIDYCELKPKITWIKRVDREDGIL